MDRIIGIGEYALTGKKGERIKTYALSSCVAITLYCPGKKAAAMVHIALPNHLSGTDEKHAAPGYYADTAVPFLIGKMTREFGCSLASIEIKLFGGSDSVNKNDCFNIGKRNLEAITGILDGYCMPYDMSETGGSFSRTVEIEVDTGRIKLNKNPICF